MLNGLWLSFFIVASIAGLVRWFGGDPGVWAAMVESLFNMAKLSGDVMLLLFAHLDHRHKHLVGTSFEKQQEHYALLRPTHRAQVRHSQF